MENENIKTLWINLTELQSLLKSILKKDYLQEMKSLYFKLGPILESFFIIYKIMYEDENE